MRFLLSICSLLVSTALLSAEEIQGLVLPFKTVDVASPVFQEVIDKVLVEEGDVVQEDQPIVLLRSEIEAMDVELAKKTLDVRSWMAKGAEALYKEKIDSEERWRIRQAEAEQARIQLEAAEVKLKQKTVRAPLSGFVVKKYKESGESADRAEKLVEIVNMDKVFVQFYLKPELMTALKKGQPVQVRFPVLNDKVVAGTIDFIDERIDAGSNLFRVKVLLDNPEYKIKAGMRGIADFSKLVASK